MGFLGGLKVFDTDIEKGFAWFGSPKGQEVVAAGEALGEVIAPASIPIIGLINMWLGRAYNVEALAVAAGKAGGTGGDKADLVIAAIAPDIAKYVEQSGVSPRTAAQIEAANKALITLVNALTK